MQKQAPKPKKTRLPEWARQIEPVAHAIVLLFHPNVEVVLHDIKRDRIIALWGMSSGRKPGDPSLLSDLPEQADDQYVVGPYEKRLHNGNRIVSTSAVIKDAEGVARGMLCLNFDRSLLDRVETLLNGFAVPTVERPTELFDRDWREQISLAITDCCASQHFDRARLTRDERAIVIHELDSRGLFATRNAAEHVAQSLDVSRALVYSILKEVRSKG